MELSLPAPATGPGNEHDDAMSISLETTAHLEGGLVLCNRNVTGMDWHNSTGGWNFRGLKMGDGMGMVSNDINNGLGWGIPDDLMNPNLPLLPESLLPVPALLTQHFISNASPSIFPQPNVPLMQQFLSTASPSNLPQPNILPMQQFLTTPSSSIFPQPNILPTQQFLSTASPSISPQPCAPQAFASGMDMERQPQANDKGDSNAKTSDMDIESGERLGMCNCRKPTESREVVPLTARQDSDNLLDWLKLASKYLYDGIEVREWKECLDIWMGFEKEIGYLEMTTISTTPKFTYISLTKGFPALFGSQTPSSGCFKVAAELSISGNTKN